MNAQITESKKFGSRRKLPRENQTIALTKAAVEGRNPPPFTRPADHKRFTALQDAFGGRMQGLLSDFQRGKLTRGQFETQAKGTIRNSFANAYRLGVRHMGGDVGQEIEPADAAWLKGARYEEFTYLNRFIDALEEGTCKMDPEVRMGLYADTLESLFWAGQAATLADNAEIHWELHTAEHCRDCLTLAANGPYTRKTLPTVPRAGDTQCIVNCKCGLRVEYNEQPAIERDQPPPWKPMREFDNATPPRGLRPPSAEERSFIENLALRIKFEKDLAEGLPAAQAKEHVSIGRKLSDFIGNFLLANAIWVVPTWLSHDTAAVGTLEFEEAFAADSLDSEGLLDMDEEQFQQFLDEFGDQFPTDESGRLPRGELDRILALAKRPSMEEEIQGAVRGLLLLEANPYHDAKGRFAKKSGAQTQNDELPTGRAFVQGLTGGAKSRAEWGHESKVKLATTSKYQKYPATVLYNPESEHLAVATVGHYHEIVLDQFMQPNDPGREKYAHASISEPINDNDPHEVQILTAPDNQLGHQRDVNATMAMLRRKGMPDSTKVFAGYDDAEGWKIGSFGSPFITLRDTYRVEVRDGGDPLTEANPYHDERGRFTQKGGTAVITKGEGVTKSGAAYAFGADEDVKIPTDKALSVVFAPEDGHLGWIEGEARHRVLMALMDRPSDDRFAHVTVHYKQEANLLAGMTVVPPHEHGLSRMKEARWINRTFAMLRQKGFGGETWVVTHTFTASTKNFSLGDTVVLETKLAAGIVQEILKSLNGTRGDHEADLP